jgi:hypothetical protein
VAGLRVRGASGFLGEVAELDGGQRFLGDAFGAVADWR